MNVSRYLGTCSFLDPCWQELFCLFWGGEYPGKVYDIGIETPCISNKMNIFFRKKEPILQVWRSLKSSNQNVLLYKWFRMFRINIDSFFTVSRSMQNDVNILHGSFIKEDKDMFLQRVGNHLPSAILSHLGRPESLSNISSSISVQERQEISLSIFRVRRLSVAE